MLLGNSRDVRRPAHGGPVVRQRFPEHRARLFLELAQRGRVSPHPALLENDVALGIKFPKDRVQNALGFHPHPQLELVGGHVDEISGQVLGREGVLAGTAVAGVNLIELILDQDFPLLRDELVKFLLQLLVTRGFVFRL